MWSPIVVQNPGAVVHAASSPASARPGDLAVRERVAPVLDAQAPARRAACCGRGDVATASTAGSELRIEASTSTAPSSSVEAGGGGQLAARARRRCRAARGRRRAPRRRRGRTRQRGSMRSTLGAEARPRRPPRTAARDELAGALAQAVRPAGGSSGATRTTVDAAARQRRRRLAGDEAGADDHGARARPRPRRAGAGRRRRVRRRVQAGSSRPATGGRSGAEPVASTQRVVGELLAALERRTRARLAVERDRAAPARSVDVAARRTRPRPRAAGRPARARRAAAPWSAAGGW